ncbi:hypothetical protein [Colwellia sp. TT2012]|uniref:hypothetical protein n=1 Tax=Colwellia sp. TT2012 TaxID=1720342 RepID=UPI00070DC217|nr:hypothetical protein [Colwellia sp. TT2012]
MKFNNSPHLFTQTKLVFDKDFATLSEELYNLLHVDFSQINFGQLIENDETSHTINIGLSGGHTTQSLKRVGYRNDNIDFIVVFGRNMIEINTTNYIDKSTFKNDVDQILSIFRKHKFIDAMNLTEVTVSNVNLFMACSGLKVKDMFDEHVVLPFSQLTSKEDECARYGRHNYVQVIDKGIVKLNIDIEQHSVDIHNVYKNGGSCKLIPDSLGENNADFTLNIDIKKYLEISDSDDSYVILTSSASMIMSSPFGSLEGTDFTTNVEKLGGYSRGVFEEFRSIEKTNQVWK